MKGKVARRILSSILSAAMILSMMSMTIITANAADNRVVSIRIKDVVRKYSDAVQIYQLINEKRQELGDGYDSFSLDEDLSDEAMARAAQLVIKNQPEDLNYQDYSMTYMLDPDGVRYRFYEAILKTTGDAQSIVNELFTNVDTRLAVNNNKAKEIGIGIITINGDTKNKYVCIRTTDSLERRGIASPITPQNMDKGDVNTIEDVVAAVDFLKIQDPSVTYGTVSIGKGESKNLCYRVDNYEGNGSYAYIIPSFAATPSGIITYDNLGNITGKATGTTQLQMILPGYGDSYSYTTAIGVTVKGESFDGCTADYKKQATYKGTAIVPTVTLKDSAGKTLVEGTDYTLSYSNNVKVGTATITVTGLGNRLGSTLDLPFEILPKPSADMYLTASTVSVGDTIKAKVTASNGLAPYTYKLTYTDPSNKTLMLSSTTGEFNINANLTGEYKLTAKVTDADGVTDEISKTVTVVEQLSVSFDEDFYEDEVGKKVAISVTPYGGIGPIKYSYAYENGTKIASGTDLVTVTLTLTKAGEQIVVVTATDSIGNTATDQVTVSAIGPLNVKIASTESNIFVGESTIVSAESTGGHQPVTYEFRNTETNEVIPSVDGMFEFKPTQPGTYEFEVTATDSVGAFIRAQKTIDVAEPLSVTFTADATEVLAGKKVNFKAEVTGGFPTLTYKYAYSDGKSISGSTATLAQTFSTAGDYTIIVTVRDKYGNVATDEVDISVRNKLSISMTASADKVYTNQDITFTVTAAGGFDPTTVRFEYGDGTLIPSNGNTAVIRPAAPGTYKVVATYLDKNGNSIETYKTFTAADPLSVKLEPSKVYALVSEKVTLDAQVTGGFSTISYSYSYADGTAITGSSRTLGLTQKTAGEYTVKVKVKDGMGSQAEDEVTYYVADAITVSASADTKYVNIGSTGTITMDASGGYGDFTYEFALEDGTLLPTQGNKGIFKPTVAGTYVVTPTAIDKHGNRKSASKITINAAERLNLESFEVSAVRVVVGTKITLTTTVSNGFPTYKYSYAYSDGKAISGSSSTVYVTPTTAGDYTIIVKVTDLGGNVVTAEKNITVAPKMAITTTASSEAIFLGKTSDMESTVTGGFPPYTYSYTYEDGTTIPSTENKASVKPNQNGDYKIIVTATDSEGFAATTSKVIRVADELLLSVDASATEAFVGDTITYKRESSGGFPTVTFTFACDNGGRVTVSEDVGTFKPTKAGLYTITVTAKDAYKHVVTVSNTVEVVEPLSLRATPDKSAIYLGESTQITAVPTGGFDPIKYKFSSDGGNITSSGDKATFSASQPGEYTISVAATDRNNNASTAQTKVVVSAPIVLTLNSTADRVLSGTKVTFTATSEGGYDTVTYKYFLDGKSVSSSNGVYAPSLTAVGDHVISVTATDKGGNSVTKEKTLSVAAKMTASLDASYSQISLGENVKFTANATGGFAPYKYQFTADDGTEIPSSGNTAVATPQKDGTYAVVVTITDAVGNTVTASKAVTVVAELAATLDASSNEIIAGGKVTFTTNATGGIPTLTYKYEYADGTAITATSKSITLTFSTVGEYSIIVTVTDKEGNSVKATSNISVASKMAASLSSDSTNIYTNENNVMTASAEGGFGDYTYSFALKDGTPIESTGNKVNLKFSETGSYTIVVTATDRAGNKATAEKTVTVSDKLSVKLTASESTVYVGSSIKLTTTVSGGFGKYTYSYAYSDGTAINGTNSTLSISPKAAGNYTVIVTVKDKTGDTKTAQVSYKVSDKLAVTLNTASTSMYVGDTMILNANGQGGMGTISYIFTVNDEITLANKNNVAEFSPKAAGDYTITVEAMDSAGTSVKASKTISVADKLTVALSASATEGVPNTTFTFNANATGGFSTLVYTYTIDNGAKITGSGNTATALLTAATEYTVKVTVKDKIGTTVSDSVKVKVVSDLDVSFTASAYKVYTGDSITFTAQSTGGTEPITYTFAYSDGTAIKSTGNVAVITPEKAGNYTVVVTAIDKFGNKVTDRTNVTVDESTELFNTSYVSADTIPLGSSVRMTGACQGGAAPYNYEFYYKKSRNSDWLKIKTSDDYAIMTPSTATSYDLKIVVTDRRDVSVEKTFTLKSEKALENTSTVSSNNIVVGTKIVLTGSAVGGAGGYQYAFYYKKSSKAAWNVIGEAYTTKSAAFRPGTATDYDVMIEVKDLDGSVATKTYTLKGKTALKNNTTINTTSVVVGNKVVLKGAASGGEPGYKYAFYYKKHSKTSWTTIGEAFTTKSAAFRPGSLTTYDVKVDVMDESGAVDVKNFTVEVVPEAKNLTNDSTINSQEITFGERVIVVGGASGGNPSYEYAFYYKKSKNTDWVTIGTDYTAQSATFKPTAAVSYDVKVIVRDAKKATAEKVFTVNVKSA